jgi:hypothetical protein
MVAIAREFCQNCHLDAFQAAALPSLARLDFNSAQLQAPALCEADNSWWATVPYPPIASASTAPHGDMSLWSRAVDANETTGG